MGILDELDAVKKAEAFASAEKPEIAAAERDAEGVMKDGMTTVADAEKLFAHVRKIVAAWPGLTGEAL